VPQWDSSPLLHAFNLCLVEEELENKLKRE
jgi:hypothetical protein